jgi:transcription elongation factor/antiterminator RfaH
MTIPADRSRNDRKWFAVALLPHADAQAKTHLQRQGFEVFAPTLLRTVRHARQFRTKVSPLFPGYLFVHVELAAARWRSINGTRGVRSIVSAGERPLPVPDSVIEALRQDKTKPMPLQPGAKLEIVSGPFAGLLAELERLDGQSRVAILMQLIGGPVSVTLPLDTVRAAS